MKESGQNSLPVKSRMQTAFRYFLYATLLLLGIECAMRLIRPDWVCLLKFNIVFFGGLGIPVLAFMAGLALPGKKRSLLFFVVTVVLAVLLAVVHFYVILLMFIGEIRFDYVSKGYAPRQYWAIDDPVRYCPPLAKGSDIRIKGAHFFMRSKWTAECTISKSDFLNEAKGYLLPENVLPEGYAGDKIPGFDLPLPEEFYFYRSAGTAVYDLKRGKMYFYFRAD